MPIYAYNTQVRLISILLTNTLILWSSGSFAQSSPIEEKKSSLEISNGSLFSLDVQEVIELNEIASDFINQSPDSAVVYATKVLDLIIGVDSLREEHLKSHKTLAKAYYVLGDSKNSLEASLKVIDIARDLNDEVSMLFGQVHLGLAFLLQNRMREAIAVFNRYLFLAKELKDSSSISRAYLDLSISYDALFAFDSARLYVDSCISIAMTIEDNYYLAMGYDRKGYINSSEKQYDSAIINHSKSLSIIDENNNWERCFAYAGLAKAYSGISDFKNSISFGQKSLELGKQMKAKWEIRNATEIISEAYANAGDYENAYMYHKLYKACHDSIFTEENERRINDIQLRQAQTERDALKLENQLQTQILGQKNVQLILLALIALIMVVLLIVLYITIKNRRKYTEELALQRDKLGEINNTKNRILSILAHDMRSPINSILQLIYLLKNEDKSEFDFNSITDEIHKRTTIISNTLDNLLEWSLSQFQRNVAKIEPVNVTEVMEEQIDFCSFNAGQKGIHLIHNREHAEAVMVQLEHLRIILRNLISNAIKYSFEGSNIYLEYGKDEDILSIRVIDHGLGMSETTLNGLFASKVNSTRGTKDEFGTGLGLFISRDYAEMNGGTLTANSQLGKGTTFTLTLPKA